MKKIILGLTTILFSNLVIGQAVFEHSYSSTSTGSKKAYTFNTENEINYYTFNDATNVIQIYNQTHTLIKTVNVPIEAGWSVSHMRFITDKLFNNDNLLEFLLTLRNETNTANKLILFNETGTLLQEFDDRNYAEIAKNNDGNYKLICLKEGDLVTMDIYSLPGTLSIEQQQLLNVNNTSYPNPTEDILHITNKSANGQNSILQVFDIKGEKIIDKQVLGNNEISLDVSNLANGIYIYKINGETHKFIKK